MFRDSGGSGELASYAMRNGTFHTKEAARTVVVALRNTVASLVTMSQSAANWISLVVMGKYLPIFYAPAHFLADVTANGL